VGDAERSQRVGGVAGMVGHRCRIVLFERLAG
jgi:hypothetical protein